MSSTLNPHSFTSFSLTLSYPSHFTSMLIFYLSSLTINSLLLLFLNLPFTLSSLHCSSQFSMGYLINLNTFFIHLNFACPFPSYSFIFDVFVRCVPLFLLSPSPLLPLPSPPLLLFFPPLAFLLFSSFFLFWFYQLVFILIHNERGKRNGERERGKVHKWSVGYATFVNRLTICRWTV